MKLIDKATLVAEIERRLGELSQLEKASYEIGLYDAYKIILSFLDILEVKEEPVSEDLEEAARKIATRHSHITGDTYYANDAWFFKKGAQWQKEQMVTKACVFLESTDFYKYYNREFIKEFKKAMEE